jgi:hypothetical protein
VFQTLSCGKAGQRVPGKIGPEGGGAGDVGEVVDVVPVVAVVGEDRGPVVVVVNGAEVVVGPADFDLVSRPGRSAF